MKSTVKPCEAPKASEIIKLVPGAYFHDAWSVTPADTRGTALGLFIRAVEKTPRWFSVLMSLRNRAVQLAGLKNLGGINHFDKSKDESTYCIGDRVGLFTLFKNSPQEVLLGDRDKHLDVTLSVYKRPSESSTSEEVVVTTVVHVHNMLGKLYMLPVTPVHKLATRSFLTRIEERHVA